MVDLTELPVASPTTDFYSALGSMVGGVGSVLAVVAAGLLLWHEMHSRNEERRDAEAAQARMVVTSLAHVNKAGGGPGKAMIEVAWKVTNYSQAPVLGVKLAIVRSDDHQHDSFGTVPEDLLPPGESLSGTWRPKPPIAWPSDQAEPPLNYLTTYLEFMDANGLVWDRRNREPVQRHIWPPDHVLWRRWRWKVGTWLRWRSRQRRSRGSPPSISP